MLVTQGKGKTRGTAEVTRDERGDWAVKAGRFRAVLGTTGPEWDRWVQGGKPAEPEEIPARVARLVAGIGASYADEKMPEPKAVRYHRESMVPLDGEESIDLRPLRLHYPSNRVVAGIVVCDSRRCRETDNKGNAWFWRRFVVQYPGGAYDPRVGAPRRSPAERSWSPPEIWIEGRDPREVLAEHRAWHAENHPVHARVLLDRWINRHSHLTWPEPTDEDKAELKKQLASARKEATADRAAARKAKRKPRT